MYTIQTLNEISPIIYTHLPEKQFAVSAQSENPDAVIVRSANMLENELGANLVAIARAGAGYNNIPVDRCTEAGIAVFNTPGANANAVKELVFAGMLLSARDIVGSIEWVKSQQNIEGIAKNAEKAKKNFVGPELKGKTLAVIGLGAIGGPVANLATHLYMNVIGYDPYLSVDAAWSISRAVKRSLDETSLVAEADYITLHVPLTPTTKNSINAEFLSHVKKGAVLLNFSRAELCDSDAIKAALADGTLRHYVVDFPTDDMIGVPGVICTPHLGASTPESEENCADMAAEEIYDFLTLGAIRNSVNLPACPLGPIENKRITIVHKNIPNMISQLTTAIGGLGINIENMINRSRNQVAYTVIDVNGALPDTLADSIRAVEGVSRVRVL